MTNTKIETDSPACNAMKALEPFASFGRDESGADIRDGLMRDRICDWFGPMDFDNARAALAASPAPDPVRKDLATALARRLCQLFDSGGESQRSVRARHASAIFQLLSSGATNSHEWQKCDADPVRYLEDCERAALRAAPQSVGNPLVAREVAGSIVGYLEGNCGLYFNNVREADWQAITNLIADAILSLPEGEALQAIDPLHSTSEGK